MLLYALYNTQTGEIEGYAEMFPHTARELNREARANKEPYEWILVVNL